MEAAQSAITFGFEHISEKYFGWSRDSERMPMRFYLTL